MKKKNLCLGLTNSGKTSITGLITLDPFFNPDHICPTRMSSYSKINIGDTDYIIWEFAGAESYRRKWLSQVSYLCYADELIYIIDAKDYYLRFNGHVTYFFLNYTNSFLVLPDPLMNPNLYRYHGRTV